MQKRIKSEEISEYVGYWLCADGRIIERLSGTVIPVYSNGTARLKKADGKKEAVVAHRLIALAFVPKPEGFNFVKFKDGDPTNRSADNLEWVLSAKVVSEKSLEIVRLKQEGLSSVEIAHIMQTTPQYINRVLKDHKKRLALMQK